MDGHSIYHDLEIESSAEKAYNAVSQPQHLTNWWPLKCSGKPEVGEEYNFYFGPDYDWYAKVIKAEEGKSFHVKMTNSDDFLWI